ncbi:MAG: hypothetical protein AW11_03851 [Candidatus Accumulibacter regalis]|uniref:Uncharacterized protein n=1 Tax=Accumulibacter regalis TaxID=522306 RepID=A0A011Q5C6_ACCRE|nr:MAG: hypothetical protein AW11_03851 [Candidatus Accumulibacter regalis]
MQPGHLVVAFLLLASIPARAETLVGTVVGVADGDTVTVLDTDHQQ